METIQFNLYTIRRQYCANIYLMYSPRLVDGVARNYLLMARRERVAANPLMQMRTRRARLPASSYSNSEN